MGESSRQRASGNVRTVVREERIRKDPVLPDGWMRDYAPVGGVLYPLPPRSSGTHHLSEGDTRDAPMRYVAPIELTTR